MERKESARLEFKEKPTRTYLKTVSAYANYEGGKIVFGVDDKGVPIGLEGNLADIALFIENAVNDAIEPVPHFSLDADEKARTVTLTVYEGIGKPYLYQGKAYRRNDTATVQVDRLELKRLVLAGSNMTFDEAPASDKDLSFSELGRRLKDELGLDEFGQDVMRTLGLVNRDGTYSNAAALLADDNSFGGCDIIRFGDTVSDILERQTHVDVSVLLQLERALSMYETYYCVERVEGVRRKRVELVPAEAFRETLANALVHREWDVPANITIGMYPDRIEVTSPGTLPAGITRDEFVDGMVSVLRNPILANVFFRLKLIEKFGTGTMRIKEAYRGRVEQPRFLVRDASVTVVLPVIGSLELPEGDELTVFQALSASSAMTRVQIQERTGFSKDKVIRLLDGLERRRLIERQGRGRATTYRRPGA